MRGSTTIQLLSVAAGDTLTASYVRAGGASSIGIRVDSESQLQIFAKYTPDAGNATAATYAEIEMQYTEEAADTADVSGGSGSITWKSFVKEVTISQDAETVAGAAAYNGFIIQRWRIFANDTANKDRAPTWAWPIGAKRISALVKEEGAGGNFGTLVLKVGHQVI